MIVQIKEANDSSDLLVRVGLRPTKQRVQVLAMLAAVAHPLAAKDIYHRLVTAGADASLATIYRVLCEFKNRGLLDQIRVPGGTDRYHIASGSAGLIVCSRCGKIEELSDSPEVSRLRKSVSSSSAFAKPDQNLTIYVECRHEQCA